MAVARSLVVLLFVASLAAPAAGQTVEQSFPMQMPHRAECIKLTKQLIRYAGDVERARERGNELWEEATMQHIGRLTVRRQELCPQIVAQEDPALRKIGQLLGLAAIAALKYFTWGAF